MLLVAFAICSNIPGHFPAWLILPVWMALCLTVQIRRLSNLFIIGSPILGCFCIISTRGCSLQLLGLRRVSVGSFRSAGSRRSSRDCTVRIGCLYTALTGGCRPHSA